MRRPVPRLRPERLDHGAIRRDAAVRDEELEHLFQRGELAERRSGSDPREALRRRHRGFGSREEEYVHGLDRGVPDGLIAGEDEAEHASRALIRAVHAELLQSDE